MTADVTVSKEVHSIAMQQISYYMAPRAHMPNTGTVVGRRPEGITSLLCQYLAYAHKGPCNN